MIQTIITPNSITINPHSNFTLICYTYEITNKLTNEQVKSFKNKIIFFYISLSLLSISFMSPAYAADEYTVADVAQHDTSTDCWMIFEDKIYDFTDYLNRHDRYMEIDEWCGKDMTEDFKDKAGIGRDHRSSTYNLLDQYYVGNLKIESEIETTSGEQESANNSPNEMPYNLIIPLLMSAIPYTFWYFLSGSAYSKKYPSLNRKTFNAFWNTVLISTLLIPSFGFGVFMMLRYRFPQLHNIDFDFMYWHVELSVVMGTIAVLHFIQRLKQYSFQLNKKK